MSSSQILGLSGGTSPSTKGVQFWGGPRASCMGPECVVVEQPWPFHMFTCHTWWWDAGISLGWKGAHREKRCLRHCCLPGRLLPAHLKTSPDNTVLRLEHGLLPMEQGYSKAHVPMFPRQYPVVHFSVPNGVSSGCTTEVPSHQWQTAVLAAVHSWNRTHLDACACSYTCTFMSSLLPHLIPAHVPICTWPWFTHTCTYVHTYTGPERYTFWYVHIYTVMRIPMFQHKCPYTIYMCTNSSAIYTSCTPHIQTHSVCTCMSKI